MTDHDWAIPDPAAASRLQRVIPTVDGAAASSTFHRLRRRRTQRNVAAAGLLGLAVLGGVAFAVAGRPDHAPPAQHVEAASDGSTSTIPATSTTAADRIVDLAPSEFSYPLPTADVLRLPDSFLLPIPHGAGFTQVSVLEEEAPGVSMFSSAMFGRPYDPKTKELPISLAVSTHPVLTQPASPDDLATSIDADHAYQVLTSSGTDVVYWPTSETVPGALGLPSRNIAMYAFIKHGELVEVIADSLPKEFADDYVKRLIEL